MYTTTGAVATKNQFTEGVWPHHIIDINCTGLEKGLWDCPKNSLSQTVSCSQYQDASVLCREGMHLGFSMAYAWYVQGKEAWNI